MKSEQSIFSLAKGWEKISDHNLSNVATIVFLFGNRELLKDKARLEEVRKAYPEAQIVGCSTSGDICGSEVLDEHIVCTAVWLEKTTVEIVSESVGSMEESYSIGQQVARKLNHDGLTHVMILAEGLRINGSELTKGINDELCNRIPVTGGLAGDQNHFAETVVVHNQPGVKNRVVAIGFYGESLRIGYGSVGGWDSFGVDREVTRSKGNILYELDGQPALQLYKRYLGDHVAGLPASALLFPLSLRLPGTETFVVRTVLSVNEEDESMVFAGDIPQGESVRLMKANSDKLIGGASDAAEMSLQKLTDLEPDLAILITCVGRKLVLKQRTEEELEIINEVFGGKTALAGFYSYGEICPMKPFSNRCELHNQTMTITAFKEL
jgi:hypothetical protein